MDKGKSEMDALIQIENDKMFSSIKAYVDQVTGQTSDKVGIPSFIENMEQYFNLEYIQTTFTDLKSLLTNTDYTAIPKELNESKTRSPQN